MKSFNFQDKEKKLDKLDCQIVHLLQQDGRLSNTSIAKELGIAEATVRTRLKRLINENYIKIVAVGDPGRLGFNVTGSINLGINIKKKENIIRSLSKINEIVKINMMTGAMDVDIDFVVKSLDDLNELVYNKISKIEGIITSKTSLVMEQVKENYAWGTAYDR